MKSINVPWVEFYRYISSLKLHVLCVLAIVSGCASSLDVKDHEKILKIDDVWLPHVLDGECLTPHSVSQGEGPIEFAARLPGGSSLSTQYGRTDVDCVLDVFTESQISSALESGDGVAWMAALSLKLNNGSMRCESRNMEYLDDAFYRIDRSIGMPPEAALIWGKSKFACGDFVSSTNLLLKASNAGLKAAERMLNEVVVRGRAP